MLAFGARRNASSNGGDASRVGKMRKEGKEVCSRYELHTRSHSSRACVPSARVVAKM